MKVLCKKWILSCANLPYVRMAMEEKADLSAFREKPTLAVLVGVSAIAFSFVLGWPAIAGLGFLSIKLGTPWIVVIGGPLTYGLSHLVFIFGMYLSGAVYTMIFCRWLVRVVMEWCLARLAFSDSQG